MILRFLFLSSVIAAAVYSFTWLLSRREKRVAMRRYLQHETNLVLEKLAKNGTHTVVVPANMQVAPLINVPSK